MKQFFEKNPEILVITISLVITIAISTLFSLAVSSIVGGFWPWFWVCLLVQVIGFFLVNSFLLQKQQNIQRALEIQELNQSAIFTVSLSCAYCKQINETQINLDKKNTFKCVSCNQVNGVFMQFTATTLTTPINFNSQLKDI